MSPIHLLSLAFPLSLAAPSASLTALSNQDDNTNASPSLSLGSLPLTQSLSVILSPIRWMPNMKGGYQEVPRLELNQSRRPSTGYRWTIRAIIFVLFALLIYFGYRFILTTSDQGMTERERAALKEGPTYDAKPTTKKIDRGTRPHMTVAIPIPGKMTCPGPVIKPSAKTPTDVNQVRPADITYVAALGDSITTGSLSYDLPEEFSDEERNFVGNSFDMGGDGGLETHLTLPNVLRHVNPALVGFSMGKGLEVEHAGLNVAFPGRWSDDFPRQAQELVERFKAYPPASVQSDWKLINFFIGTNDITGICRTNTGTPKDQYKAFLREAIVTIQKGIPRSIISLIGMWNLDFQWRAAKIIYNTTYKCSSNFDTIAQARIVEYREAINELAADAALQTKTQAVVVQRVFDDLTEPLKRPDGTYDANFYATDVFHLSKYGNSLVAKQLWKQLVQPVGQKSTTNDEMASNDATLACPDKDCPFIRTIANSQNCVIPDYNVTTVKPK